MKLSAAELFSLAVTAIFVQNLVMVWMLGSNVFFKALRSPVAGMKYGVLVTISTTVASVVAWLLKKYLLSPYGLDFLSPFAFALVVVVLGLAAELLLRLMKEPFKKLGALVPASVFNVAVLGLVLINVGQSRRSLGGALLFGLFAGIGYLFALFTAASAMERVRNSTPPAAFRGAPIALVTASLISLAFMGFAGMQLL